MLLLGQLTTSAKLFAVPDSNEKYGLLVINNEQELMRQPRPARVEVYRSDEDPVQEFASGYSSITRMPNGLLGRAEIRLPHGATILVHDRWRINDSVLHLSRGVEVEGSAPGGFL